MKIKDVEHKHIVLFDMDNTLVCADTGDLWVEFLFSQNYVNEYQLNVKKKYKNDYEEGCLNIYESYLFDIELIKNLPVDKRNELRTEFFNSCLLPHISAEGSKLIKWYQKKQDTIVILITATIDFIAAPVAEFVGIEHLIATMINIDKNEPVLFIQGIPSFGAGKIERFNQWKDKFNIFAVHTTLYTDSINDLPLLNHVNFPVVVDPDDALRKVAVNKNWPIISFKNDKFLS